MFDHLLSGLQIDCLELDDPSVGVGDLLVHVDVQHNPAHLGEREEDCFHLRGCMIFVRESLL